jgi:hypothetical protein
MRNQDGKVKRVQVITGRSSLRNTSVSDRRSGMDSPCSPVVRNPPLFARRGTLFHRIRDAFGFAGD